MLQTSGESFKGVSNESVNNLIILLQQGTHGVSLAFLFDPIVSLLSIISRWIQAVFHLSDGTDYSVDTEAAIQARENILKETENNTEVDISDGVAAEMFGILPNSDNEVRFHYLYSFPKHFFNISPGLFFHNFLNISSMRKNCKMLDIFANIAFFSFRMLYRFFYL